SLSSPATPLSSSVLCRRRWRRILYRRPGSHQIRPRKYWIRRRRSKIRPRECWIRWRKGWRRRDPGSFLRGRYPHDSSTCMRDDARLSYGLRDGQLGWDSRPPCLGSTLATLRAACPRPSRRIRGGVVGSQRSDPAWICALCWLCIWGYGALGGRELQCFDGPSGGRRSEQMLDDGVLHAAVTGERRSGGMASAAAELLQVTCNAAVLFGEHQWPRACFLFFPLFIQNFFSFDLVWLRLMVCLSIRVIM
ncbi:unnamed protein product, partial [Urochloa humidicola]